MCWMSFRLALARPEAASDDFIALRTLTGSTLAPAAAPVSAVALDSRDRRLTISRDGAPPLPFALPLPVAPPWPSRPPSARPLP